MSDHPAYFTVKTVAERIARAQFAGEADVAAVARFVRVMLGRGLIVSSVKPQGGGVTAPNLFDEAGLYRAAILVAISRVGVSDDLLTAAAARLDYLERERDGNAMSAALEALADRRPFFFHLFVVPKYFSQPGNVRGGMLSRYSDGGSEPWAVTITVPLQTLVANLDARDEAHDGNFGPVM